MAGMASPQRLTTAARRARKIKLAVVALLIVGVACLGSFFYHIAGTKTPHFPPVVADATHHPPVVWESGTASLTYSSSLDGIEQNTCVRPESNGGRRLRQRIPDRVHFVFGLNEDFGGRPWGFVQYASVLSAKVNAAPRDGLYLHYVYEPQGPWWELTLPLVTLVRARNFTTAFGHDFERHAHRADVLRLEILHKFGGVYVDSDTWVVQPFRPLLHNECVLGYEGGKEYALGNAAILAAPGSPFIEKWLATYAAFNGGIWHHNGLVVPTRLAMEYPSEVCIAPPHAFLAPLFDERGIDHLHRERTADDCREHMHQVAVDGGRQQRATLWGSGHFSTHLWLSHIRKQGIPARLANLTYVRTVDTLMTWLMRPVLDSAALAEGDWPTGLTGYEGAYWIPDEKEAVLQQQQRQRRRRRRQ